MTQNPLRATFDRLGFFAYTLAVSGGRPDWSLLFGVTRRGAEQGGRSSTQHPFADTVPFDIDKEREKVAGY